MSRRDKKVSISKPKVPIVSKSGSATSIGVSPRISLTSGFTNELNRAVAHRKMLKVIVDVDGQKVDVTPKFLTVDIQSKKNHSWDQVSISQETFSERKSILHMLEHRCSSIGRIGLGPNRLSMDDILSGIGEGIMHFYPLDDGTIGGEVSAAISTEYTLPYIKVKLNLTGNMVLYEQNSNTAPRQTHEGELVEQDNRLYDYLTIGKGKIRRRSEAEVQTNVILMKSRDINTVRKDTAEKAVYVSYFEMFDTYEKVNMSTTSVMPAEIGATSVSDVQDALTPQKQFEIIAKTPAFQLASMIIQRMLAGNVHKEEQTRFRNMIVPDRMSLNLEYRYTLRLLFQYPVQHTDKERKSITDLSFNNKNGDILAVSYGIYSFSAMHVPRTGIVCVWNIKNPGSPERVYYYSVPVVSVEFSPFLPTLLAVGLYDGSVEVRDITYAHTPAIAVSQRSTSPAVDPVVAIRWIKQTETADTSEIDPFLTLSQDGSVTKYRIINSPYLLGCKQMLLERIEGDPEGLLVKKTGVIVQQANRHPQGLSLTIHPLYKDIYYVLTDEGCLHKCSTNYTYQYLEVWKTHEASVNCMDFSPWSPKLFLTCGNDWCIRVWIDGIFKPLLTLKTQMAPIHCAYWSHTHSTIILSVNRRTFDIWDIRRNLLKPVSSTSLESSFHTLAQISRCGRSVAIGNERGVVLMAAFDDFPFPTHFQYDHLEKALYKAISTFPDLIIELKSIGFFGYPHKRSVPPM